MNLLLDTHIALWALADSTRLPHPVAVRLLSRDNRVFVSLVSVWEVAIKHSIVRPDGQRRLNIGPSELLCGIREAGFELLALAPAHCEQVDLLPYRVNPRTGQPHADPFDRMLVAQAMAEPMHLITADKLLALYASDAPGLIEAI